MNNEENNNTNNVNNAKNWSDIAARPNDENINNESEQIKKDIPQELLDHPDYLKLMDDLTKAEQDRDELKKQLLFSKADLENTRKRFERDLDSAYKYSIDRMAIELLPVIDSLERGLEIKFLEENSEILKNMHAGMELTIDLFLKALQKYGVTQINPLGEIFNPKQHEAMLMQDEPSASSNTILKVMQKGYLLHDRVLRPALVVVTK